MEKENTKQSINKATGIKKDSVKMISHNIKIKKTPELKELFDKWNSHARYSYNTAMSYLKEINPYDRTTKEFGYEFFIDKEFNAYNDLSDDYRNLAICIKNKVLKLAIPLIDEIINEEDTKILKDIKYKLFSYTNKVLNEVLNTYEKGNKNILNETDNNLIKILKQKLKKAKLQEQINKIRNGDKLDITETIYTEWYKKNNYIYNRINDRFSLLSLRNEIIPESVNQNKRWITKTPFQIREKAVFEAKTNIDIALKNFWNGNTSIPSLNYRTKKKKSWSIGLRLISLNIINSKTIIICPDFTNKKEIQLVEPIKNEYCNGNRLKHDYKIIYDGKNYYLSIPREIIIEENYNQEFSNCSIDPGVNKFLTIYNPEKDEYIKIGDKDCNILYNKMLILDDLISRKEMKQEENKEEFFYNRIERDRLTRHIKKLRIRISNLQKELHKKVSNYLCCNFKSITIPKLNKNNELVENKNNKRKIRTSVVRKMLIFAHNKFIEMLKTKANQKKCYVDIQTEEYTSQVCIKCKKLTKTSLETYICKHCKNKIDRDIQGSRNIFVKDCLEKMFNKTLKIQ